MAREVHASDRPLNVAIFDCTTAKHLCEEYHVRGYPSLKFLSQDISLVYQGARTKDELLAFADKCLRDPVLNLLDLAAVKAAQEEDLFFVDVSDGPMDDVFQAAARQNLLTARFFHASMTAMAVAAPGVYQFRVSYSPASTETRKTTARKYCSRWGTRAGRVTGATSSLCTCGSRGAG